MRLYKIAHVALYFGIFGPWGFFATFICDASDGLAGWGGWIRTSAFQNRNSPRLSAWAAGFGGFRTISAYRFCARVALLV